MIDRVTAFIPMALLALLAASTYWLNHIVDMEGASAPLRHDPDYIITNFTVQRFDDTGALQHTMIATRLTHYPDDDTSVVTAPHLINHRQPVTEIFAELALSGKQAKQVDFVNNVRVVRQGTPDHPLETVMTTHMLTVFPDDEIGYSTTPVTITQGNNVVHGSSLDLNNKTGIAVLHGRVTGILHSQRKPSS
jgi:lipopolysaccharide export system protein LptC